MARSLERDFQTLDIIPVIRGIKSTNNKGIHKKVPPRSGLKTTDSSMKKNGLIIHNQTAKF
jgi:hypothetical protein